MRDQPKVVMQRGGSKKAVDGGNRSAYLREKSAPAIGDREVNREHSLREPSRKLMIDPYAQFFATPAVRNGLYTLAYLSQGKDAYEQGFAGYLIEPGDYRLVRFAPDGL